MLKLMSFLMTFSLFGSTLLADPAAGSYAQYAYTVQNKAGSTAGTQVDSILAVSKDHSFQLKTEVTLKGQVNQTSLWSLSGSYFSDTAYFIDNCEKSHGDKESITVAAGTFDTCHILFKEPDAETLTQEVWLSTQVPLFIVRQIRTLKDQSRTTIELQVFTSKLSAASN